MKYLNKLLEDACRVRIYTLEEFYNKIQKRGTDVIGGNYTGESNDQIIVRQTRYLKDTSFNNFEKQFIAHELTNALRGKITHPFSHSQLDHILISNSFSVKNAKVIADRFGSDHCPIHAEIQ